MLRVPASGLAAVVTVVATVLLLATSHAVASRQPSPESRWVFDVASVKVNRSDEPRVTGGFLPGGRYQVRNYSLRALIAAAYLRPQINPDFLIDGGPDWIDKTRFDVDAVPAGEVPSTVDGPAAPRRAMLQNLLADRFGLRVHREPRQAPIYTLERASGGTRGTQLRPANPECPSTADVPAPAVTASRAPCALRIGPGSVMMRRVSIAQLVSLLPRFVNRIVVDHTMVEGLVDLDLAWTPAPGEWVAPPGGPDAQPAPVDGPSLFTALEEQLGMRLLSGRGAVEYLVIDGAHVPVEN